MNDATGDILEQADKQEIVKAIWTCEFDSSCSRNPPDYKRCGQLPKLPCPFLTLGRRSTSLLLYLETCLVDQYGRIEVRRINEEEITIIKQWITEGFVEFGRLRMKAIQKLRGNPNGKIYSHWVRFSDAAWRIAHKLRRQRSDRMIGKNNAELLGEQTIRK